LTKSKFSIEWSREIKKDLQALDKQTQRRIFAAIELLRSNPRPAKMRRLISPEPKFRVRVGDYRIITKLKIRDW